MDVLLYVLSKEDLYLEGHVIIPKKSIFSVVTLIIVAPYMYKWSIEFYTSQVAPSLCRLMDNVRDSQYRFSLIHSAGIGIPTKDLEVTTFK